MKSKSIGVGLLILVVIMACGTALAETKSGSADNYNITNASYSVSAGKLSLNVTIAQGAEVSIGFNHNTSANVLRVAVEKYDYNMNYLGRDSMLKYVAKNGTLTAQMSRSATQHCIFRHNAKRYNTQFAENVSASNLLDECLFISTQ